MIKDLNILVTILLLILGQLGFAQVSEPILSMPEEWKYEKIDFPLSFASEIPYQGFEELRFAPGMFDTLSTTYFTYLFVLAINNKVGLSKKEAKDFLSKYYKGLCKAVAESREMSIDLSMIEVSIKKSKRGKYKTQNYHAQVNLIDAFTNGQKILLHMELEVLKDKRTKKSYVLVLASPQSKPTKVWKELYRFREKIRNQRLLQLVGA